MSKAPVNALAVYEAEVGGQMAITADDVRFVICGNPKVTDQEMRLFAELCKAQRLNPYIHEAYLVKYGDNPATIVTGKEVFTKRAQRNPRFRGMEAGVTVMTAGGEMVRREGSMVLPGEAVVGGWAKVIVDGYDAPIYDEVSFDEYAGRRKDGTLNGQWASKPGTMIRKVALVHALREAFPEDLQGLYDSSEMEEPLAASTAEPERISAGDAQAAMARWRAAGKTTEGIMASMASVGVARMGDLTPGQLKQLDSLVMSVDTGAVAAQAIDVEPVEATVEEYYEEDQEF